jgi:hypothetical protein
MSARVVAGFGWLLPHLEALESDFSRYHRVDDMYAMPVATWVRRLSQLPAYGGAFAIAMQSEAVKSEPAARADGELSEAEVQAKFRQILADTYPDQAAGGIKEISAEEMAREVSN